MRKLCIRTTPRHNEAHNRRYQRLHLCAVLERHPDRVIEVFKQQQALLLLSEDILAELERKLSSAKFAARVSAIGRSPAEVVDTFRGMAEIALPADVPEDAVRDPKDRMILACALGGKADVIVSGDKDLITLKDYQGILIVTPSDFLNLVTPSAE